MTKSESFVKMLMPKFGPLSSAYREKRERVSGWLKVIQWTSKRLQLVRERQWSLNVEKVPIHSYTSLRECV